MSTGASTWLDAGALLQVLGRDGPDHARLHAASTSSACALAAHEAQVRLLERGRFLGDGEQVGRHRGDLAHEPRDRVARRHLDDRAAVVAAHAHHARERAERGQVELRARRGGDAHADLGHDRARDLGGGALRDDAAVGEDADLGAHRLHLLEAVRRDEERLAGLAREVVHVGHELVRRLGVEAGGRLVEEDEVGVGDERAGDEHLLPHALRVRADLLGGAVGEPEAAEQVLGAAQRVGLRHAVERAEEGEVVQRGQALVEGGVGLDAHARPDLLDVARHVVAEHAQRLRAVGPQHAGQDADGRRLARAVGAEQPEHAARLELEIDALERRRLAERPGEPDHLDCCCFTVHVPCLLCAAIRNRSRSR